MLLPLRSLRAALILSVVTTLAASAVAMADEAKPKVLADVVVIPEVDFAKHPPLGPPVLSPDGEHIAVALKDEDKGGDAQYHLAILHLPDLKYVSRLDMAPTFLPIDVTWVDNKRLVMGTGKETAFAEAPRATGDILAVDIDGKNKRLLYSLRARGGTEAMNILKIPIGFGTISGGPDKANGHFYLTVYPAAERGGTDAEAHKTLIFDVDAISGSVKDLGAIDEDGYAFLVHNGVVRYAWGQDNNLKDHVYYRAAADKNWTELPQSVVGKQFRPEAISADGSQLYSVGNPDGGPAQFAVSQLDGSARKVLASNPRVSVARVFWTPVSHTPYAVAFEDGRTSIDYLNDSHYAQALKALNEKFSDHAVGFSDISENGAIGLVSAVSDRDPGTFAMFDFKTSGIRPLYQSRPWFDATQLGERKPFWFKASSGTELGGYLTLPPKRVEKNLPTVLIAHGGPMGPHDPWSLAGSWENIEAQFLASRGYAVVQVNYRGSGGRGANFFDAGYRQMGTGMMQDMLDGLHWAIDKGYVDKNRVCVYGASYGGYTAYFQPVYAPQGTFKCAVAIAGVSDIRVQTDHSDTRGSRGGRNFLREAWGMDDDAYIKANSAVDHVDKFNVPVLIVHGEDDRRVPIKNAEEMRDALQKAGKPFEYMSRPKEGHGFFKEANNTERYKITEAFLLKYLGPGAPPQ